MGLHRDEKHHIFISYSRKDLDLAGRIVSALAERDLDTWIDWKSIPKGEEWEKEIYRGIEGADAFIFLISPDSIQSEMCNKEVLHAVKNNKRILPVLLREVGAAAYWDQTAGAKINSLNWIFYREGRDSFIGAIEQIQRTIRTDYDWVRFHTMLQVKALAWERSNKDGSRLLRGRELNEASSRIAQSKNSMEPAITPVQRRYILQSRRIVHQQRAIAMGVLLFILLVFIWWNDVWVWVMPIKSTPSALTQVVADIDGLEALPVEIYQSIQRTLERQYIASPEDVVSISPNSTAWIRISPTTTDKVLIETHLPITPAYRLDFLPEIRDFEAEMVNPEEASRLIRAIFPYSVGRYRDAINTLKGTDSLTGLTLLAQSYLFENDFDQSRDVYARAIEISGRRGLDSGRLQMGAALSWWMPNLSQTQTGSSSRSAASIECVNAHDLYTSSLSSSNARPADYHIFQIAAHYCGNADWGKANNLTTPPDVDEPYSMFVRILPRLSSDEEFDQDVMEELRQTGKSIVYARYELAWYALIHSGGTMLCDDFDSALNWYAEGVVTELDRNNVRSLIRMHCGG